MHYAVNASPMATPPVRVRGHLVVPRRLSARHRRRPGADGPGAPRAVSRLGAHRRGRRRRPAARQPGRRQGPGARDRIAGRPEDARRIPAPHRLRSDQAAHQPHRRLPRRRARQRRLRPLAARRSLRRGPPGRLRARRAAEDRRRSHRDQARPPDALVVEARPRPGGILHRRTHLRAGRGRLGRAHGRPGEPDQPERQRRDQPGAGSPGGTRGRHARDLGRRDRPRRDPPLARRAAGPQRGGHHQHDVGRDRLRQGHGGGADRGRRDARTPPARWRPRSPSRCATPNATRRC